MSVIRDLCIGTVAGQGPGRLPRGARAAARGASVSRADRLAGLLEERELDSLLVSNLVNVRYLTGFTGTNGACVVARDERLFLTDSRYVEQAKQQVQRLRAARGEPRAARRPGRAAARARRLRRRAREREGARSCFVEKAADGVELAPAGGLVGAAAGRQGRGRSWRPCAPPSRSPTRAYEQLRDDRARGPDRARGGALDRPLPRGPGAPTRCRSRRSWRPVRTGRCRTPSRATSRSRAGRSWWSTWARASTGTARTARARWRPARWTSACARATRWCGRRRRRRSRRCAPGRSARRSTSTARERVESGFGIGFDHGLGHGVGLEVHEAPAAGADRGGLARGGQHGDGRAGPVRAGRVRDPHRGPGGGDRAEGCEVLTGFPKELVTVDG